MLNRRNVSLQLTSFAALISLAGCGNVPQPFRRAQNTSNPLLANPSGAGIGILPPAGLDDLSGRYIANSIAETLRQQEIPAEALDRAGVLAFTVEGNLNDATIENGVAQVAFDWRLLNRLGEIIERLNQEIEINSLAWIDKDDVALDAIANNISAQLILLLAPPVATTPNLPETKPWAGLTVTIQRPETAPGDGAQALGRALANRLLAEGFQPPEDEADFIISARISLSIFDAVQDDVSILWSILSPDGENLGDVRLDNRIPRGQLDGAWGQIAEAIVDSAFPGLLQIVVSQVVPRR
ncbi:MAG: hypothetical protein RIB43_10590 [Rhodospirillaceae bacterium]